MKVAIDVTPLRLTRAGTARYLENLLARVDADHIAFGDDRRAAVLARELWWYPLRLSAFSDADVLHCPTYYGPLRPRIPTVVTVHDLAVLRNPEWFRAWTRTYAPHLVPAMIRAASRVIAVSEFTARETEGLLGIPRERIRVVRNGVEPVFMREGPSAEGDYVLAVGTLEPRKNLQRTIAAAKRVGVELRVVGDRGWGGIDAGIAWQGRVDDEELARLYRGAKCVVYPSLYEGFGLPVGEALACGAPVVTSRDSAMADLAGDQAVLIDPFDVDDIARGITEAIGREVRFTPPTWDDTARLTRAVYEEAAS